MKRALVFVAGILCIELNGSCDSDASRLRDREVDFKRDPLTEKVRDSHCHLVFVRLELESRELPDVVQSVYLEMARIAPRANAHSDLVPHMTLNQTQPFTILPAGKPLDLSEMKVIDALNKICEAFDVYFCYRQGNIEISADAEALGREFLYEPVPGQETAVDPFANPPVKDGDAESDTE